MAASYIGLSGIYARLRNSCAAAGGQGKWAAQHGMSAAYVSDVINARRDPGPDMLKALGVKKITLYAPIVDA